MCNFGRESPYDLIRSGKVTLDEEVKIPYHTTVYVTCKKCSKKYSAGDHAGYHFNYWSWSEVYEG